MGAVTSESNSKATEGPEEPLPPPNPPASPGEGTSKKRKKAGKDMYCLRIVPKWVTDLVTAERGTDIHFIAEKTIEKSDLASQQNRFYLPKDFVKANLVPMLSELERESASLVGDDRKRSRVTEGAKAEKRKAKVSGREHGGLPVVVFTRCRFRCYLKLTRWDGSAGTVIKGDELKYFALWSFLKEGDEVETWAFRRGGDLCFAIGKPTASSSSCGSRHAERPPCALPLRFL
ncbi:B3 domain-containing protein At1g05920-like [Musa acuminata AAA Group]|uniref:B3 domain-containing protein At1g05920-like n=1 Tax=Musa acuminata AAA Group TaxID=214697 RepID=UPI0031D668C7